MQLEILVKEPELHSPFDDRITINKENVAGSNGIVSTIEIVCIVDSRVEVESEYIAADI